MFRFLLLALAGSASALKLPSSLKPTVAAATLAAPLPAFAVAGHELVSGEYGDVAMNSDAMLSAVAGTVIAFGLVGAGFDYMLKYGASEGCIISDFSGEEVCGKIIDRGEQGCVLSDELGWVCGGV